MKNETRYARNRYMSENGISPKRFKELCGFCEQYPEWKEKLIEIQPSAKSMPVDGMPYSKTNRTGNPTMSMAIKRAELESKISVVEKAAKEAGADLWEYLILNACYGEYIDYLITVKCMPCSKRTFIRMRKSFFAIIDKYKG